MTNFHLQPDKDFYKRMSEAMASVMPKQDLPLERYCYRDGHRVHRLDGVYQCITCGKRFTLVESD